MINDLISREALIKAVENLYEYAELGEVLDVIKEAPAVEAKIDPNDIYYLCDHKRCGENFNCYACNHTTDIKHAVNFDLVEFPRSAFFERARPRGEWIFEKANNERIDGYICSICGQAYHTKVPYFSEYKYCPNCGAKMEAGDRWKEEET